jgi:hypothetical protein
MLDWFNLHTEVDEAFLRSECDERGCQEELMLSCKGSELNRLLLGKSHVFNSACTDAEERTECRFRIWMRRSGKLSAKAIEAMRLGSDCVGQLQFWKDQDTLDACIFVEDAMFERWSVALLSMRHQISATVTIGLDQNFSERYIIGDESHVTWNLVEGETPSKAKIRAWNLELTNRLWKDSASKSPYK